MQLDIKTITLAPLGELEIVPPRPSVIYDIISEWSAAPSRAHMGRLTAAAIGASCPRAGFPRYDSGKAEPIAYGGRVLDHLLAASVDPNDIVIQGMARLSELAPQLVTRSEVTEKEDFISPPLPAA